MVAIHLLMILCATLVSTSFTVGDAIANGMDPAVLTLLRFFLAALLFAPWIWRKFGLALPRPADLGRYAMISGALVGFFWLMFQALRSTSALNTSVIFTLVPGISGLYSAVLLRERLGSNRLLALALATAGAIWVIFRGDLTLLVHLKMNQGDLLFFIGCLLMALYTPLVKLLHRGESMALMTFWILVTGCGWLLVLAGNRLFLVQWSQISLSVWAGIVYLAVFCTIITFFLSQYAVLFIGPTRVMAYSYLYPPLVIGLELLSGHPLPSLRTLAGILLIIPAMVVVQRQDRPTGPKSRPMAG